MTKKETKIVLEYFPEALSDNSGEKFHYRALLTIEQATALCSAPTLAVTIMKPKEIR